MATSFKNLVRRGVWAVVFASAAMVSSGADEVKAMPLAEARAQIGAIAADPSSMADVIGRLSAEDQCAFLGEVNAAIAKMPGSNEERAAKLLNVNRAALKGASKGNVANVMAEVFATVPPESLTVISERFAADLINRNADPSRTYTDEEFLAISTNMMAKIERRTSGSDDAGVRNTFAAVMFLKASGSTPQQGLAEALVAGYPDKATRDLALNEWIPQAMAANPDYEGMLGYADAGAQPNAVVVLDLAGPQMLDAMLFEMVSGPVGAGGGTATPILDQAFGGFSEQTLHSAASAAAGAANFGGGSAAAGGGRPAPRTSDPTKPWYPGKSRGETYPWQTP